MAGFYIKEVIAKSEVKETASVSLSPGLNIIQGRSNTGKTCIAKCVEFVFGADLDNLKSPFKESAGYNEAVVVLGTEDGDITISRTVGKRQVEVSAPDKYESGTYCFVPNKRSKNPKPPLNLLMMQLLGIDEEHEVPSNSSGEKSRMTWTNLLRLFYVKEGRIDEEKSIIEPDNNYEKFLFLSSLLFLLTGRDFKEMDSQTKKEIREARKEAVRAFANKRIQHATERKEAVAAEIKVFEEIDVEKELKMMVSSLKEAEEAMSSAMEKSKSLLKQIMSKEERAAECNVLLSRYQYLFSQYKADIQRLSFIVDGEQETKKIPKATTCPFCDGKMVPRNRASYIETSKAELSRIIAQMKGLQYTEESLKAEQVEIVKELEKLRADKCGIETSIEQTMQPKVDELEKAINARQIYIQLTKEAELIAEFAHEWDKEAAAYGENEKDSAQIDYHPKEFYPEDFETVLTDYADEILKECQYHNLVTASFDKSKFDIRVNGEDKATSHGKGYRSYLNTVVALMFRKYLKKKALYNPELLILDTPLLGFDEEVAEDAPESMKAGLFTYFMNHQEGQLIIIENLDHIPHLDYKGSGANVITFTKREIEGERYGFLNDVY